MNRIFREAGRETEPTPEAVARVRHALSPSRARLRGAAGEPDPGAVRRVLAGVGRRPRSRPGFVRFAVGVAVVVAVVVAVAASFWGSRPVRAELRAEAPTTTSPVPEVALLYQGEGSVSGDPEHIAIDWVIGSLEAEVEPHRGIQVRVVTEEARVTVTGTIFRVTRSALGTEVAVTRGGVDVACEGGSARRLSPGESTVCIPLSASGRLGRARALRAAGAASSAVLAAADEGLAVTSATDPVRGELLAFELDELVSRGEDAAAAAVAAEYLAAGFTTRHDEVAALAAMLAERNHDRAAGSVRP